MTLMKLNPKAFAMASGVLWAACIFVTVILNLYIFKGFAIDFLTMMAGIYPGFTIAGLGGAVVGAIYGFIDGFIGGWFIAWLYNRFLKGE